MHACYEPITSQLTLPEILRDSRYPGSWRVSSSHDQRNILDNVIARLPKLQSSFASEVDNNAEILPTSDVELTITAELPIPSIDESTQPPFTLTSESGQSEFTELDVKHVIERKPVSPASDSWMFTRSDGTVIKLQKCCAKGQGLVLGQPGEKSVCGDIEEQFIVDIYYANRTHYWKYATSNESNIDIIVRDPCTQSKYYLNPNEEDDKFRVLSNGSLYYPYEQSMYNTSKYCVDILMGSSGSFVSAVLCTSATVVSKFHYFYGGGQLLSMIMQIGLAIYQMQRTDIDDDHKKCLTWFSGTMAAAYSLMALYTFFNHYISESRILAFFLYYIILKYFIWLNILCYDTYRCVRDADKSDTKTSYMKIYLIIAFSVPFIFIAISCFDNFKPALPNLYAEYNFSSSIYWCIFLFFIPIGISAMANIFCSCHISFPKQCRNIRDLVDTIKSADWKEPPKNLPILRNMYKRSVILFILMFIIWVLDFVIFFVPSNGEHKPQFVFRDVVACLQGLFITCIFIKKDIFYSKCRSNSRHEIRDAAGTELQPMTNGQH
ncbi:methuselah-like 14 [Carabus blaptoides fortunei]